jgi:predicted  nucleic acid-binding Zn-ribbon protein
MINSLQTTKSQLTIASEMADSQLKASSEKDLQSTELKNIIASLQKELETTSDEKSKLEAEVDDLQKKLKKCKKAQRAQKKEIEELQQSLSKDD